MILVQSRNEKSSLSFSKSERHTFWYRMNVNASFRLARRSSRFSPFSAFSMPSTNRPMYHSIEYWYIGSIIERSAMQKKRLRDVVRDRLVALAHKRDLVLRLRGDLDLLLDLVRRDLGLRERVDERLVVEDVARRVLEQEEDLVLDLLELALVLGVLEHERCSRCASSSGSSFATAMPSIWSCSPSTVAMKLSRFTLTTVSGA